MGSEFKVDAEQVMRFATMEAKGREILFRAEPAPHYPGELVLSPERPDHACEYCFAVGECESTCHKPTSLATRMKRVRLERKLESTRIDETRLKDRAPKRSAEVIAHDVRRKLLERAEMLLDNNDLDNAVTLINAAKGLE